VTGGIKLGANALRDIRVDGKRVASAAFAYDA
jgi:succinate dehydrogenase/fumarate reductase flavoprotein subunit